MRALLRSRQKREAVTARRVAARAKEFLTLEPLPALLTPREAHASIDWQVLLMLYGLLGLGMAMQNTGTAEWLAKGLVGLLHSRSHRALVSSAEEQGDLVTGAASSGDFQATRAKVTAESEGG